MHRAPPTTPPFLLTWPQSYPKMAEEVLESDIACLDHYDYFFRPNILQGKVAFITGGGSGIGFTITEVLMR